MKKILTLITMLALVVGAQAQNFSPNDFLSGNQAVFITNNSTVAYGAVGVPMTNQQNHAVFSLTNLYSTNSIVAPGNAYTNSNAYNGYAWNDVISFSDRDGNNGSGSIAVSLVGTTADTTQAVAFTFVQMLGKTTSGTLSVPATATQNKFVFAVTPTGTTPITIATNIPTAQMQGTAGWRLSSIAEPNNAAAGGVIISTLTLNGYRP